MNFQAQPPRLLAVCQDCISSRVKSVLFILTDITNLQGDLQSDQHMTAFILRPSICLSKFRVDLLLKEPNVQLVTYKQIHQSGDYIEMNKL